MSIGIVIRKHQSQDKARLGKRINIWHESPVTHTLLAVWGVRYDGDTHFRLQLEEGSVSGQAGKILEFFFSKLDSLFRFISQCQSQLV